MNDVPENVISRISKLLARAESENEHEASVSMAFAQNLLAKYQLSLSDINVEERIDGEYISLNDGDRAKISKWKSILLHGLAQHNFCYTYRSGTVARLIGRQSARHAVLVMYNYLVSVIDNATEKAWSEYNGWEHGKTYKNSFRRGMVNRIITRLQMEAQKVAQEAKANSKEIVPVNPYVKANTDNLNWIKSQGVKLRSASDSFRSGAGYNAGRSAGDNVSLSRSSSLCARNK